MGTLSRGGTTSQQKFVKSGLSKSAYKKKQSSDYLKQTGKSQHGDRAFTSINALLPGLPEGETWKQETNKATGKVRYVSGNKSTSWRTPEQWDASSYEQIQEIKTYEKLAKDPVKYVQTYVGQSGIKKYEQKTGKIVHVTKQGVFEESPQESVERVSDNTRYVIGEAGETKLLMSSGLSKRYGEILIKQRQKELEDIHRQFKDLEYARTNKDKKVSKTIIEESGIYNLEKSTPSGDILKGANKLVSAFDLGVKKGALEFQRIFEPIIPESMKIKSDVWTETAKGFERVSKEVELASISKDFSIPEKVFAFAGSIAPMYSATSQHFKSFQPYLRTVTKPEKVTKDILGRKSVTAKSITKDIRPKWIDLGKVKTKITGVFHKDKLVYGVAKSNRFRTPDLIFHDDIYKAKHIDAFIGKGIPEKITFNQPKFTTSLRRILDPSHIKSIESSGRSMLYRLGSVTSKKVYDPNLGKYVWKDVFKPSLYTKLHNIFNPEVVKIKAMSPTFKAKELFLPTKSQFMKESVVTGTTKGLKFKGDFSGVRTYIKDYKAFMNPKWIDKFAQESKGAFAKVLHLAENPLKYSIDDALKMLKEPFKGGSDDILRLGKGSPKTFGGTSSGGGSFQKFVQSLKEVKPPPIKITDVKATTKELGQLSSMSQASASSILKVDSVINEVIPVGFAVFGQSKNIYEDMTLRGKQFDSFLGTDKFKGQNFRNMELLKEKDWLRPGKKVLQPGKENIFKPENIQTPKNIEIGISGIGQGVGLGQGQISGQLQPSPSPSPAITKLISIKLKPPKEISFYTPFIPITPIITVPPPPGLILPLKGGEKRDEELLEYKEFIGFRKFDISQILKGSSVLKNVDIKPLKNIKLPNIKI